MQKIYTRYPFDGLKNCRDLGGMPTSDGGVTRFGVLLRSELPRELSDADKALVRSLGVTTSIDLRSTRETVVSPSAMRELDFVRYLHLPLFSEAAALGEKGAKPPLRGPQNTGDIDWAGEYIEMLEQARDWSCRIVDAVAEAEGAVHFHCTTGKDRTGLFAMLMMAVAGCSSADIIANYSVSEIHMRPVYLTMAHILPGGSVTEEDLERGFFCTSQANMRRVLEYLEQRYGGPVGYLRDAGVTEEAMERIREKFVEK